MIDRRETCMFLFEQGNDWKLVGMGDECSRADELEQIDEESVNIVALL
jgi:hypothetical protein